MFLQHVLLVWDKMMRKRSSLTSSQMSCHMFHRKSVEKKSLESSKEKTRRSTAVRLTVYRLIGNLTRRIIVKQEQFYDLALKQHSQFRNEEVQTDVSVCNNEQTRNKNKERLWLKDGFVNFFLINAVLYYGNSTCVCLVITAIQATWVIMGIIRFSRAYKRFK